MPIGNLGAYRGSYEAIAKAESVSLTFYGEDIQIFMTTTTKTKIKVKIDGNYVQELIWHTGIIYPSSNVFDVSYTESPHSYYDSVDTGTANNPSVLRLSEILDYGQHTLLIEVINETDNVLNLEAIAVYDTSLWKNIRDIDTTLLTNSLSLEQDIEEQRNDVIVVGTEQGTFNKDGQIVNPNNPIYIHTYSRAVDLSSIYNADADNYMGKHLPFEVYNERILSQLRANHISLNALKKYRDPEITASFEIPADPRLTPFDPIGFNELKLNMLPDGERIWVDTISEAMTANEYLATIIPLSREPMPSFETKAEPDIHLFNNEPIINIVLKSQGKRVSGDDASSSGSTVTIATTPDWINNMWDDYYFYDDDGQKFEITDTLNGNQLTVDLNGRTISDGNWSISFDPFDTDQKGSPLEIHYDQVINGKVQIWVKDAEGVTLAKVNKDNFNLHQEWGEDRVVYWNGSVEFNILEGRGGCYISESSAAYTTPLHLIFNVIPENPDADAIEINTDDNGELTVRGVTATRSDFGAMRIYPVIRYETPMVKVTNSGSGTQSEDIHFWGYANLTTRDSDEVIIDLLPNPGFTTNEYQDYLIADLATGWVARILSNTSSAVRVSYLDYQKGMFHPHMENYEGLVVNFRQMVMIVGQTDVTTWFKHLLHDHFKSTDNDGQGLKLVAEIYNPSYTIDTSPNEQKQYLLGPNSKSWYNGTYLMALNTLHYSETYANPVGQQHPQRSIWYYLSNTSTHTDEDDVYDTLKQLIPFSSNVLVNADYRITANLIVYRVNKEGIIEQVGGEWVDYFDSNGYVKLEDFAHFMKPENLIIEGSDDEGLGNVILQHSAAMGWYFLFKFRFMDRAGRFTPNTYYGVPKEDEPVIPQHFGYLVAWQPNDPTRQPLLQTMAIPMFPRESKGEIEVMQELRSYGVIGIQSVWSD